MNKILTSNRREIKTKTMNLQSKKPTIRTMTLNSTPIKNNNLPTKLENLTHPLKTKNSKMTHSKTLKSAKLEKNNFGSLMTSSSPEENLPNSSKLTTFTKRTSPSETCSINLNLLK